MSVLDLGCGPGSITVGLAEAVSNGRVVGVDIEEGQIGLARERAAGRGLSNCQFEVADVKKLPFDTSTFDAVFGHTIMMQFRDVRPVLREIDRVLKPGGIVGLREGDLGAVLAYPPRSAHARVLATLRESIDRNEGFPDVGRQLPSLLAGIRYSVLKSGASYNIARTVEERRKRFEWLAGMWGDSEFVTRAVSEGWLALEEKEEIARGLEREADDAGVFLTTTFCECLARKPG